jgi:hypothetical protein
MGARLHSAGGAGILGVGARLHSGGGGGASLGPKVQLNYG